MYPAGEMAKPKERGKHRLKVESDIIRRREKEFVHQQMWGGAEKYYRHWEKANNKFEAWTSPRYYEDNNKMLSEIRNKREKEELLAKRKEKLKKLLSEEQSTYEIELMVRKNKNLLEKPVRSKADDIPTEVLKDVNMGLKLEEEERRRREAETKLYHQWRKNNPIIRQYESKYRCKDLKLSWLDQQIEKRMQREKEEEEAKKFLKERDERLRKEREKAEQFKKYVEEKRQELRANLDQQMQELRRKQESSMELRKVEEQEMKRKAELAEIVERQAIEEKRRLDRECALFNIRQHKLKLRQKAVDIQEDLMQEKLLVTKLKQLELEDVISDELKRNELKQGLDEFINIIREQQELENQRQKHLEFLFDSEARMVYEKQTEMWRQEESSRQKLLKDVIETIQAQIQENIEKNNRKQQQLLEEREEMTKTIEEYDRELQKLKEEEEKKKESTKKMLDEDLKVKNARKKQQESFKLREIDEELEKIRKEEERLQQEILRIQRREGPVRPPRSRLFY